jgi:hypothetical protein
MPRDGSGIYTRPPGTNGVPDTTIESSKYNSFVADVEADLNAPRPIIAGGTGASSASAARANLKAEVSGLSVTNYDTQVWENGSFTSAPGATGAPDADGFWSGVCTMIDVNAIQLTARRYGLNSSTYIRTKSSGVWAAWAVAGAADFVNVTGDTMTGNLVMSSAAIYMTITGSQSANIISAKDGVQQRWTLALGNGAAESGGNAGSDLAFYRFNDAGAFLGVPLSIIRASGVVNAESGLTTGGSVDAAGNITAGNQVTVNGGTLVLKAAGGGNSQVYLQDGSANTKAILFWEAANNKINLLHMGSAVGVNITSAGGVELGKGFYIKQGSAGAYGGSLANFYWDGSLKAWIDTTMVGTVTITSDYRTKKDVADLASTWDAVKALRPVKYTQAQYTPQIEIERKLEEASKARDQAAKDGVEPKPAEEPQPMFPADDVERWGFVAHELQETLIESAATGYKDAPDTVQSPNPFTLIAALTKALQEAMARIEALESANWQAPVR